MNQPGEIDMMVSHMEDAYDEMLALWKNVKVVKKESVNEAKESPINVAKRIVKNRQAEKIDGVLVDMQTANLIVQVHGALNPKTKKRMEKLPIKKMANVVWKLVGR